MKNPTLNFCSITQLKKVHWKASYRVLIVKVALDTLIGRASNAVAEAGSPQHFSFTKAEWTSQLSEAFLEQRFPNSKLEDAYCLSFLICKTQILDILQCLLPLGKGTAYRFENSASYIFPPLAMR